MELCCQARIILTMFMHHSNTETTAYPHLFTPFFLSVSNTVSTISQRLPLIGRPLFSPFLIVLKMDLTIISSCVKLKNPQLSVLDEIDSSLLKSVNNLEKENRFVADKYNHTMDTCCYYLVYYL